MPVSTLAALLSVLLPNSLLAQPPKGNPPPRDAVAHVEEKFTLRHQPDIVWCVAFSPDGKTLASVSGLMHLKGELILWDAATGRLKSRVQQPLGIRFVSFSPDGATVATSDYMAKTATLRKTASSDEKWVVPNEVPASAVAFSGDGTTLAVGGQDGCTRIWDIATRKPRATLQGPVDWVLQLTFTPDHQSLVTCGRDRVTRLWDLATGTQIRTFAGHTDNVEALALSPDGRTLATGSWDKTVKLWEVATGGLRANLANRAAPVLTVAFSADGRALASGSGGVKGPQDPEPGEVRLWDVAGSRELLKVPAHPRAVWGVAIAPDNKALATASLDHTVKLWSLFLPRTKTTADLTEGALEGLWNDLASADAGRGHRAVWALVGAPRQAVPFLTLRLSSYKTLGPDEKRIQRLIAELDDDDFTTREKAGEDLKAIGRLAIPVLQRTLEKKPSAEIAARLKTLLGAIKALPVPAATVRAIRCIEALEAMGTTSARACLSSIARKTQDSELRREVEVSIDRLSKRITQGASKEPAGP